MTLLLSLLGIACWGIGFVILAIAKGAPHEIEAMIMFLAGVVCFASAAVLWRLEDIRQAIINNTDTKTLPSEEKCE